MAEPRKSSPPSIDIVNATTESLAGSVDWVVGLVQNRDWCKRLLLIDAIWLLGFKPEGGFILPLLERFFDLNLPDWYGVVFWVTFVGFFLGAVVLRLQSPTQKLEIKEGETRKAVKGLRSFTTEDADIFDKLQRSQAIHDCLNSLNRKEFRFGILMGESGCGKTSLLQAGILPRLNQEDSAYRGIYVRFSDRPPLLTIRDAIFEDLHPPADWQAQANQANLFALLQESQCLAQQPLVLMFDQFEQFFTTQRQPTERQQFITALAEWYQQGPQIPVKILISIRADLYHELFALQQAMGYTLGPYDVFKLELFEPEEAAEILQVIANTEGWAFDRSFILRLATGELSTSEGKISPVDLQILAETIRKLPLMQRTLDEKTFRKLGGLEKLLENYVRETLDVLKLQRLYAPAVEILVTLIDRDRNVRTGALTLIDIQTRLKGTATPREVHQTTTWLASGDVRLISTVEQSGETGYELAHERIIPAVLSLAGQTLASAAKANRLLERRVNEWLGNNRSRRYLFSWRELWLLRRQKQHLVWGQNRRAKQRLLEQSWQRIQRGFWAIFATLLLLSASFLIWLSPYGQIKQMHWELAKLDKTKATDVREEIALTFAKAGDPSRAIRLASSFSESGERAIFLAKVAEAQGQLDKTSQTMQVLAHLRSSAESFSELEDKARVLTATAVAFDQLKENDKALELLVELQTIVEASPDLHSKGRGLMATAKAYSQLQENDKALELLPKINVILKSTSDLDYKMDGLTEITKAYSQIQESDESFEVLEVLAQLLTIAEASSDPDYKIGSLTELARIYGQSQKSDVVLEALKQIRISAESTLNSYEEGYVLGAIAKAYSQLQAKDEALEVLAELQNIVESSPDLNYRIGGLTEIAEIYSQVQESGEALEVLAQLRTIAEASSNLEFKVNGLAEIAQMYAQLQKSNAILDALAKLHTVVKSLPDPDAQTSILMLIAETYAQLQESDIALAILRQSSIAKPDEKVHILMAITEAYDQQQESDRVLEVLAQTRHYIESLTEPDEKAWLLTTVAKAYSQLQKSDEAVEVLKQAQTYIESVVESDDKSQILVLIAEAYAQLGKRDEAQRVLMQARTNAKSMKTTSSGWGGNSKDSTLKSIAEIQADLRDWRQVNITANACSTQNCESDILAAGLMAWAEQQHPELHEEVIADGI